MSFVVWAPPPIKYPGYAYASSNRFHENLPLPHPWSKELLFEFNTELDKRSH